ncbi:MAG: MYXO-CTERM sorting domain-containing protein [Marinagarivorans sp.]|nr:MYXO-CTERM sorting domain-containing protein [Marinagarivorans sp.]
MKKIFFAMLLSLPFFALDVAASQEEAKQKVVAAQQKAAAVKLAAQQKAAAVKLAAQQKAAAVKLAAQNKQAAKKTPVSDVPEINGAGAALALGLLGGLVAIRRERKKLNANA